MTDDTDKLQDFIKLYGAEITDEIIQVIHEIGYGNEMSIENVDISVDIYEINTLNKILSGYIDIQNQEWYFEIESGNSRGTYFLEWRIADDKAQFTPPPEFRKVLKNNFSNDPASEKLFRIWKETEWFKKLEKDYNYDSHFEPTNKTHSHYRKLASERGLYWGSEQV